MASGLLHVFELCAVFERDPRKVPGNRQRLRGSNCAVSLGIRSAVRTDGHVLGSIFSPSKLTTLFKTRFLRGAFSVPTTVSLGGRTDPALYAAALSRSDRGVSHLGVDILVVDSFSHCWE